MADGMIPLDDAAIAELAGSDGLIYVATQYSGYPEGQEAAYRMACKATGWLMRRGISVFSPIVHGHAAGAAAGIDPLDHEAWMRIDLPFMEVAQGLIVVQTPDWKMSRGVAAEIAFFRESCLPIYGMAYAG